MIDGSCAVTPSSSAAFVHGAVPGAAVPEVVVPPSVPGVAEDGVEVDGVEVAGAVEAVGAVVVVVAVVFDEHPAIATGGRQDEESGRTHGPRVSHVTGPGPGQRPRVSPRYPSVNPADRRASARSDSTVGSPSIFVISSLRTRPVRTSPARPSAHCG